VIFVSQLDKLEVLNIIFTQYSTVTATQFRIFAVEESRKFKKKNGRTQGSRGVGRSVKTRDSLVAKVGQ
jgi:hypothetical protein